ncbi:phasin family protein [Rhodospirillaceae bacterium SYSU D60014]|uniref:phasin family protein n=1 Tax=Virgifigura deserti TaxID=2268457 RepID=UPI000E665A7E
MRTVKSKSSRSAPRKRAAGKAAAVRTESVKETSKIPAEAAAAGREQVETLRSDVSRAANEATALNKTAVDAWAGSGTVFAKGVEDMSKAWLRLTQQSMENGVAAARAMLQARTLHDVVGVQSDYARNSFGSLMAETAQLSELSVRVAQGLTQEAMRPIQARLDERAERTSRPTA